MQQIGNSLDSIDEDTFLNNLLQLQSTAQYQFLIIGEAITHVEDGILEKYKYLYHIHSETLIFTIIRV